MPRHDINLPVYAWKEFHSTRLLLFLQFSHPSHIAQHFRKNNLPPKSFLTVQSGPKFKQVQNAIKTVLNFTEPPKKPKDRLQSKRKVRNLYVKKVNKTQPNGDHYIFYNWYNTGKDPDSPTEGGHVVNIHDYTIIDNRFEFEDFMIYNKDDRNIIFGKVLPQKSRNDSHGQLKTRQLMNIIPSVKPNAKRDGIMFISCLVLSCPQDLFLDF